MAPSKRKASKVEKINRVKKRRNLLGLKSWKSRRRFILYKNLLQNEKLARKAEAFECTKIQNNFENMAWILSL